MRKKSLVTRARIPIHSDESDSDENVNEQQFQKNAQEPPVENRKRLWSGDCGGSKDPLTKKRQTMEEDEVSEEHVNLLRTNVCIACDGEDDEVLLCHETGCLVAIHEKCMNGEADFDELGDFYCPYCWLKHHIIRSAKLKEKVMAAEKMKVTNVETTVEMDTDNGETSRRPESVVKVNASFGEERVKDQQKTTAVDEIPEFNAHRDAEKRQKRVVTVVEGSNREIRKKDERQINNEAKGIDPFDFGEVEKDTIQETRDKFCDDEQREANVPPTVSSPVSRNGRNRCDPDAEGLKLVVHPKCAASPVGMRARPSDIGSSNRHPSRPLDSQIVIRSDQAKQVAVYDPSKNRNFIFGDGKRRRLNWTPKEEEMLKAGIQEFAAVVNKNIPWRKILEFGKNVFHEERTPIDLKDKWKNMNKVV